MTLFAMFMILYDIGQIQNLLFIKQIVRQYLVQETRKQ